MGDTWITDMSHFDFPDEKAHELPAQAKRLAEYFGSIIEATLRNAPLAGGPIGVRCRRRPRRRPCPGWIQAELHSKGNELYWQCPVCGERGHIRNWKSTRWDPQSKPSPSSLHLESGNTREHTEERDERISGTVAWDEKLQGELPKIVTGSRTYTWLELGQELMTYEGFRIDIMIS
jgi:hypothetical protein